MNDLVARHIWKVLIIVLVVLGALWFAPRPRVPTVEPPPPAAPR